MGPTFLPAASKTVRWDRILKELLALLHDRFDIGHTTIQIESSAPSLVRIGQLRPKPPPIAEAHADAQELRPDGG